MFTRKSGSRGFAFHDVARRENDQLHIEDPHMWGALLQRIRSLAAPDGDRWGGPATGNLPLMISVVPHPPAAVLIYVVRRDSLGIGALLVHLAKSADDCYPPPEAFNLARARLDEMPRW